MIKLSERWSARCDKCNKVFEVMGKEYIGSYKVSLESDLRLYGWRIKGKKCLCPECKDVKTY